MKRVICWILLFAAFYSNANALLKSTEDKLTAHLKAAEKRYGIVGQSVVILKNGEVIYLGATGFANLEFNIEASPQTVYSIYSATKLFVSIKLLQLIEKKLLSLDDTLKEYFPNIPKPWSSITLLQVLSHMSGIPEYSQDTMIDLPEDEAIDNVAHEPMEFPVGTLSRYNQTNFYYIQKLIERFEKKDLVESIGLSVIEPQELESTSFGGEFDVVSGRATRYGNTPHGFKRIMRNDPPDYYYAANGMNSSVIDIAKWFQALLGGELLSKEFLKQVWTPIYLQDGSVAKHTHGWEFTMKNQYTVVGHHGANLINIRHFFKTDIKEGSVTVIHLTNGHQKEYSSFDLSYTLASEVIPEMKMPATLPFSQSAWLASQ